MPASRGASVVARPRRGQNATAAAAETRVKQARRGVSTANKAGAMLVSEDKPLTQMQRTFVKLWAQGESPLSASLKAGYTDGGTYAYRMIRMPNILKLYQEEKAAYERDSGMSRAKVIEGFMDAIEMSRMLGEPSTMVAGWREIGKMCGYYEPVRVNHTHTHEGKILHERLESMTDAELFHLIQQQAEAMKQPAVVGAIAEATGDSDGGDDGEGGS